MVRHTNNEHGAALLISIMAITVVTAIIAGVATAAILEHRQGQNTAHMGQAFAVSEQGLNQVIADWDAGAWNALAVGQADTITGAAPLGTGDFEAIIERLNQELFFVDVTGTNSKNGGRQRLGGFVKLLPLNVDIQASLTTRGPVRRSGNGRIDGTDLPPAGWAGCGPPQDDAGIRVPDASLVDVGSRPENIIGNPPIRGDPSVSDDTFFDFGDTDWDALVAQANKTGFTLNNPRVAASLSGDGTCNLADVENWGDPLNPAAPCGGYFPVIYAPGNLTLNTGSGQGMLLVEGDLRVQGKFEFYGVVIVKGSMTTAGGGAGSIHFRGAVMAANVDLDDNRIAGNANIQYSTCAVSRAQAAAGVGSQLRSRGWLQLF